MLFYRIICFSLLVASPAYSATFVLPAMPAMDPVGTGCIEGGGADDPFPSSKGVRAPAFCLHDPCDRSLTRAELSRDIIGRDVDDWEWHAYYSRYAEMCRAEAVNPDAPVGPVTAQNFWAPLLQASQIATAAGVANTLFPNPASGGGVAGDGTSLIPVGSGGFLGGNNGPSSGGGGGTPSTPPAGGGTPGSGGGGETPGGGGGSGGTQGGGGSGPDTPPVVPLPLPVLLLLSGLIGALMLRRTRPSM